EFRQRRGRRGDNSAGGSISEGFKRDQRSQNQFAMWPRIRKSLRPLLPPALGLLAGTDRIAHRGAFFIRRMPRHHKTFLFAGGDFEVANSVQILYVQLYK